MDNFCGSPLWDPNVTWSSDHPYLTPCFKSTVLVWTPCLFLVLSTPLEIFFSTQSKYSNIKRSCINVGRELIIFTLIILTLVDMWIVLVLRDTPGIYNVDLAVPVVKLITFIIAGYLGCISKHRGIRSSGIQFIFWFLLWILAVPKLLTETSIIIAGFDDLNPTWSKYGSISYVIFFLLVSIQLINHCFADKHPNQSKFKVKFVKNPELNASFISRVIFAWFDPITWKGYKKPLTVHDLPEIDPQNVSIELWTGFNKMWKKYKKTASNLKNKKNSIKISDLPIKVSLLPVLFKVFGGSFLWGGVCSLGEDILRFLCPIILRLMIDHTSTGGPMWQGYFLMLCLWIVTVLISIFHSQFFYYALLCGFKIRSALISAIYRKTLTASNFSGASPGEIVNLVAVDANRFVEYMQYAHTLWSSPLVIVISLYFLWTIFGWSILPGVLVVILMVPLNVWFMSVVRKLQGRQMILKDERICIINEIISSMKVLKCYTWESRFKKFVEDARSKEIKTIWHLSLVNALCFVFWGMTPFVASLVTFAMYVYIDDRNIFDARTVFVGMSLFNIMRLPTVLMPLAVAYICQLWVGLQRINKYLDTDDLEPHVTHSPSERYPVEILGGTFSWNGKNIILKNISLNVGQNTLAAIVGVIGSGKSSLISSILGETQKLRGTVNTYGKIAYVSQAAWIQNMSIEQNILFGKPLNQDFYNRVLDSCALISDLETLPHGDQTLIGENGVNLSGGQKQRVALARAVYSQADIYLLDDPLSAVDSHVGHHIFEQVIGPDGMLAEKCRILVTHGLTFLPKTSIIYVLNNGEIKEKGTYDELMKENGEFSNFIELHAKENNKNHEDIKDGKNLDNFNTRELNKISSNVLASKKIQFLKMEFENETGNSSLLNSEETETGSIKTIIYINYVKSIGFCMTFGIILSTFIYQALTVYDDIWLANWSSDPNANEDSSRLLYVGVYAILGLFQGIFSFTMSTTIASGCLNAARILHLNLLNDVLRLPMSFFDATPKGTILNRFSKDIDVIDNMAHSLRLWLVTLISLTAVLFVVIYTTPIFAIAIVPLGIVYYFLQMFYKSTSTQLMRVESASRSPVYSFVGETIKGQAIIRAFGEQERFITENESRLDFNQKCIWPGLIVSRWITLRLDFLGSLVILFAVLCIILEKDKITASMVGLSISSALQITNSLALFVQTTAEMEVKVIANERTAQYGKLKKEASDGVSEVPTGWPKFGQIKFINYTLKYHPNDELVLKDITFTVEGNEKIGIVGRTGAGKSSLALALFRIIEKDGGQILIDDLDISKLNLNILRSSLTIIPQDPVLFSGTIRKNIDPTNIWSDDDLWKALEKAYLKDYLSDMNDGLDTIVFEGGVNLSVGQRQLLCLARALLRKTKILILDEATAGVDLDTDNLIQKTIRNQFNDCTVLTIAHRLNTVMDSDKILVLDNGCILEYDTPGALLSNENSSFYSMANDAKLL